MSRYDEKEKHTRFVYILIFFLLAAGIAAGGFVSYRNFEQQFRDQAETQLSAIATLKVNNLVNWHKERLTDAEMLHQRLAFSILLQAYLENPNDSVTKAQIQNWLDNYRLYPEFDRVRLLDTQGRTRLSSPGTLPPISSMVVDHIPEVLKNHEVTLVDFYRRELDNQIRLSLLIPIMDAQMHDQVIGLVSISIDPQKYLYPFINEWPGNSASAETLLVRRERDGALFLNELRFQKNTAMSLHFPLEDTNLLSVRAVLGQTGVVEGTDYRGEPVIGDLHPIPDTPWFLVTRMDTAEVYAPVRTRMWQTFGVMGIAILLAGASLMILWRQQRIHYYRSQVEAAEVIRENEKQLVEAQIVARMGSYSLDILKGEWKSSEVLDKVFGIDETFERSVEGWASLIHPEDRQLMMDYFANEVIGQRIRFDREYRIVRNDDRVERWVHGLGELEFDNHEQPIAMIGTIQDITEYKRMEEVIQQSHEKYRRLVETANEGILMLDPEGRLTYVNDQLASMLGYSVEEMIDQKIESFLFDDQMEDHQVQMKKRSQGQDAVYERCMRSKDGSKHWVLVSAKADLDSEGKFEGSFAMVSDVTERKLAQEELRESEQKYRLLFDEMLSGIAVHEIICDPNGKPIDYRFIAINNAFEKMTGLVAADIIGKTVLEAMPDTEPIWIENYGQVALTRAPIQFENFSGVLNKHFEVRAFSPEYGKFATVFNDISERKQAENMIDARLRLIEFSYSHPLNELLQKTLDEVCVMTNSPIGFYHFIEPDQKTIFLQAWSTRTEQEYCKAEGKGLHYGLDQAGVWADAVRLRQPVIHNDYASLPASSRKGLPEGHAALVRELVVPILREDWIVAILGIGNKAQDYTQKDVDIVAYFADVAWEIAERKRAEQQLADYAEHLEEIVDERTSELRDAQEKLVRHEKLAVLGQVAGSIGHELRNPLGVISNAIYFLKMAQPNASDKVKEYLNIIENEARSSDKIITDLLDFTRLKSVERKAVPVSDLIRQTLERYPAPPTVEVELEIPSDLPQVYVDSLHLLRVLGNLILNAYQAMPDGGRLHILSEVEGPVNHWLRIIVKDSGVGISADNMPKLFEPLFSTKTKGIGLGLPISRKLIEANGGRIEVNSEEGAGSTFTLYLPIHQETVR